MDSTGIKVTNRDQWLDEREMRCKKEKIFENSYIAVNVKSKKILSIKVTIDEHVHDDSKALPELVDEVIKSNKKITIGKLFGDGAYEG